MGEYWLIGAAIKCQCISLFLGEWVEVKWKRPVRGPGKGGLLLRVSSALQTSRRPPLAWETGHASQAQEKGPRGLLHSFW